MKSISLPIIKLLLLGILNSCGMRFIPVNHSSTTISGIVTPFLGSISRQSNGFITHAYAANCADPVYVKLFEIESDGSIDESSPIDSQRLSSDAKYEFKNLKQTSANVQYLVKAEGCNNNTYKRPITALDSNQDIDAKTTIVSEVVNLGTSVEVKLNEATMRDVQSLITAVAGQTTLAALNSLKNDPVPSSKFTQIFGSAPSIISNARPEVSVSTPVGAISEQAVSSYNVQAFHVDPAYSFAYVWKVDGVVKSTSASMTYIPGPNDSGTHFVDIYVGKDDGSGAIDVTKPYYTKTMQVRVNNNVLPVAPAVTLNSSNPSPITSSSFLVDINTGASKVNCNSFTHLALTSTPTAPGIMEFNIDCSTAITQTESFTLSDGEGSKTLYLWAMDREGQISSAQPLNLIYDQLAPAASISMAQSAIPGSSTQTITLSGSDSASGLSSLKLFFSSDGGSTYSLVATLATTATTYHWTAPAINTATGKLKLEAIDNAGRITNAATSNILIDSNLPAAPSVSLTSLSHTNIALATLSIGSCTDTTSILVNESATAPLATATGWQTCSTTAGAISYSLSTDGTKTLYAWAKDAVGNIALSANSVSVIFDTTAPVISAAPTAGTPILGGSSKTITWSATDTHAVTASIEYFNGSNWSTVASGIANSGSYSWTAPVANLSTAKLRLTASDVAGNTTISTSNAFVIDSSAPVVNTLSLNSGATSTTNNSVATSISVTDSLSNVVAFCLKNTSGVTPPSTPAGTDSCWVTVDSPSPNLVPSLSITVPSFYYSLGFTSGTYSTYVFAKDAVGNISSLTNASAGTLGQDKASINYSPGSPPVITNVVATNTDSPSSPPTNSELTITAGNDVYIKWNASDDSALPATPITISYSLNESTYTQIVTNVPNTAGTGCTVDGTTYTGCFRWSAGSPSSSYFKVRVAVTDASSMTSFSGSSPNNTGTFKILAGNMDPGLGGSATSAMFFSNMSSDYLDTKTLVVTPSGVFYFRDAVRGLLKIDPANGKLVQLVPITGVATDGAIGVATLQSAYARMILDYQGNLIFYDKTKIRKFDTSIGVMSTLVGGGALTANDIAGTDLSILCDVSNSLMCPLLVLPNGNIYFLRVASQVTSAINGIWMYDATNGKVYQHSISGIGTSGVAVEDLTTSSLITFQVDYNPTNSVINKFYSETIKANCTGCGYYSFPALLNLSTWASTGTGYALPAGVSGGGLVPVQSMTGEMYAIPTYNVVRTLWKYNRTANSWSKVLGGTGLGYCADGTAATSCNTYIQDAFVSSQGTIYFMDNGLLRTVDENGNVKTLFGQRKTYGDSGLATYARFNAINSIDFYGASNRVAVWDVNENVIREFTIGSTINKITDAASGYWGNTFNLVYNQANGNIFYNVSNGMGMYNSTTSTTSTVFGNGATPYQSGDTLAGNSIAYGYPYSLVGFDGTKVIASTHRYSAPNAVDCMIKAYDSSDSFRQSHLSGASAICTNSFSSSGATSSATVPIEFGNTILRSVWNSADSKWYVGRISGTSIYALTPGGSNSAIPMPRAYTTWTMTLNASSQKVFYYCANGLIYKYNSSTATETALTWPSSTVACSGTTMVRSSSRNSVIFPFTQNGLAGVAEIVDTP